MNIKRGVVAGNGGKGENGGEGGRRVCRREGAGLSAVGEDVDAFIGGDEGVKVKGSDDARLIEGLLRVADKGLCEGVQ
ncbi:hypothetical protein MMC17_009859, partial [Xylographa soralifera]|nr:hypothetical protein [Xylographa soralifera]